MYTELLVQHKCLGEGRGGLQASLDRESNRRTGPSDEQVINSAKR